MKLIGKTLSRSCVYFTVAEFAVLVCANIMMQTNAQSDYIGGFLGIEGAFLMYVASLLAACLNLVLNLQAMPPVLRRVVHFVLFFAGMYIVFAVIPGNTGARFTFVFSALFVPAYLILTLISFAVKRLLRKEDGSENYEPVYGETGKKG